MNRTVIVSAIAAIGAVFYLVFGIWPMLDARSFFDQLAVFEPYNPHFIHDIGAFQVGIGATLAAALWKRHDALFAALAGAGIGTALHTVTHIADHDLGGKDSDAYVFGVVALVLIAGAAWRLVPERKATPSPASS